MSEVVGRGGGESKISLIGRQSVGDAGYRPWE